MTQLFVSSKKLIRYLSEFLRTIVEHRALCTVYKVKMLALRTLHCRSSPNLLHTSYIHKVEDCQILFKISPHLFYKIFCFFFLVHIFRFLLVYLCLFEFLSYRIGPFEVESALIEHQAVAEAAVVSSPDSLRGEVRWVDFDREVQREVLV